MTGRTILKNTIITSYFVLLLSSPAYSGLTGAGFGELALGALFPYFVVTIQVAMSGIWLVLHIWPKGNTCPILTFRTSIDVIFVLSSLVPLTFLANISQYRGYWQSDFKRYCQFYTHYNIVLIIPLVLISFFANKWLATIAIKKRTAVLISFLIVFFLLNFVIVSKRPM